MCHRYAGLAYVLSSLLGAAAVTCTSPAEACGKPGPVPFVAPASPASSYGDGRPTTVPSNAGIVFQAEIGDLIEADARATTSIEVRAEDATLLTGRVERIGRSTAGIVRWRWQPTPDTALPLEWLNIQIKSPADPNGSFVNTAVYVEDRQAQPRLSPATRITLETSRTAMGDPDAPTVQCHAEQYSCEHTGPSWTVPTRAKVFVNVAARLTAPAVDGQYFEPRIDIVARRAGQAARRVEQWTWTGYAALEPDADEYCANASVISLLDGSEVLVDTVCVPNTFSPTLSEADERDFVRSELADCQDAVYPTGTSEEDPTGRGSAAVSPSTSSCAVQRAASSSSISGVGVLAALALAGVRRRAREQRA